MEHAEVSRGQGEAKPATPPYFVRSYRSQVLAQPQVHVPADPMTACEHRSSGKCAGGGTVVWQSAKLDTVIR